MRDDKVLGSTVRIDCTTHDSTGALVAPSSAFAASDFRIYKDGSAAEKTSTNGITVTSPFDSIVGKHLIEIDTSNSTGDSGFWAAGSEYRVELNSAKTISSIVQSGVVVGRFALVAAGVLRPTVDGRTIAVSATTGKVTAEAVELDPATRVKLDATQPDYVPATAEAVAAEAVKTAAIQTKTDNLPSDPADQSLIVAATDAVMTRLGAPAGASISADIAAIGGGGGGDATLAKQNEILDRLSEVTIGVTGYAQLDIHGVLQLKRGHTATLTFTSDTSNIVSDMSAETVKVFFGIKDAAGRSWLSLEGTKLVNTGLQSVRFTITAALAAAMINGEHFFDVVAVYGYNASTTPKYTSLEPFTSGRAKVTDLYVDI